MADQVRVRVYEGLYRSQTEDLFEADATEAAGHGWFPADQAWTGSRLTVSYAYRTRSRTGRAVPGARDGRGPRPARTGVANRAAVAGTVLAAVLLLVVAVLVALGR